ncbi:TonB-dependent siderophore receptor [Erythrobacter sp.]|jgi:iron complex outermembrane receptor protein|uniref:TonB-dependent siderophore receptor n=1 Tax=Erythrobacter sp. TaxID=1042 RepID=UPI002EA94624|nr:TonB-dependent siderophore receptor [Erythrobacter sp.]
MTNRLSLAGSGLVVAIFAASPALASEAAEETKAEEVGDEILVTDRRAYRGDFDPLETPNADQVINEDLLRDANALSLDQALDLSASVARQNNFGGLWNSFSVRGFSGDINLPSGFLVNGFNAGRGFGGPRDMSGIESVEVLKGPRAALYGRGEPGGTVNLVTKRPGFETSGYVQFQGGAFDFYRGDVDLQTTFGDNVGVRIAGFYEDAGSFRETVETTRFGLYPSVTALLGESTRATYELEYSEQDIPFDRGVVFSDEFGFSPRRTFTGEPGDGPIETEVIGHQFELLHEFSSDWSLLAGIGFRETELVGNASEPNFGGRQTFFLDGRTISRFFRFRDYDSEYLVARAELAGRFDTGALSHRVLIGADTDRFENSTLVLRARPPFIPAGTDISTLDPATYLFLDAFDPVYGRFATPTPGPNVNRDEVLEGFGIYIQDQIEITDSLQIRIGARFDDFEQDLTNLRADPAVTVTSEDDRFSPQVGAVWQVDEGLSLYASYGEGFRQQSGSDFQGNQFAPNITNSAEIGLKADAGAYFEGVEGIVTLTAFEVEQGNILVNDNRPEAVAAGFFSFTAGEARSRGIEFDANLAFDSGLNVWVSYAYIDAEFTNSNPDPDFGALIEAGDPLINSPDHQLSVLISQSFEASGLPLEAGGRLLHVGERLGWTGFDFFLPDYTIVGLFAEAELAPGLTLRGDIDNLFDATYYTNSFADVWVQPGAPTSARVTARFAF